MFEFQSDDINEKKFKKNEIVDSVLVSNDNPEVVFLTDAPLSSRNLNELKNYLKGNFSSLQYSVISVLGFQPSEKDLGSNLTNLYLYNSIDLTKFVKPWSKIVTIGRALYSISGDDLSIDGFYDTIQWDTSFFDPKTKCQIFPVPFMSSWLGKDCFENYFTKNQISLAVKHKMTKVRTPKPVLELIEEPNDFLNKWLSYDGITAFDLETKGLDPWATDGKIICLTLSFASEMSDLKAYYLPFNKIDTNLLDKFFSNKKLIGNNLKYDVRWLRVKAGIQRENIQIYWDNMKGSHAINELQYNSLKSDAWLLTSFGGYDIELEKYKIKYPACKSDYSLIPKSIMFPYASMDALVSLLCYFAQQTKIDRLDKACPLDNGWSIRRSIEQVYIPAVNMFVDLEINGMNYNWDQLTEVSKKFKAEIEIKRKNLYDVLKIPESVNIDSGDQFGAYLESIGWEDPGRSKKGHYLTNEESLSYWSKKGHKEVPLIEEYVTLKTLMKTYIGEESEGTGYWQYRKPDDKLHGSFAVMMAASWRGKSYDPNLQNIPKRSDIKIDGRYASEWVRSCFSVPSDDYLFSENDAAGLQLRIGATMSQDKTMIDIFTKYGGDMHSITAQSVLMKNVSLEEFISRKKEKEFKDTRSKAKTCFYKGALVQTSIGFIPIENLCTKKGVHAWLDSNIKVIGRDLAQKSINATYVGTSTKTVEFVLENGDIFSVTPDHEMIVLRDGTELKINADKVLETDEFISIG